MTTAAVLSTGESAAAERLAMAVTSLARARTIETITETVRSAARLLLASDGATFVLRDNGFCKYVDEDAIQPLWKGQRFPMESCITGLVMLNRTPIVIPDVALDSRIPQQLYARTFVKSMVAVPVHIAEPVGAIGVYWASRHHASREEVSILQTFAEAAAVAMENARLWSDLANERDRVAGHARELEGLLGALGHADIGIWKLEFATNTLTTSPGFARITGLQELASPLSNDDLVARMNADDIPHFLEANRKWRETGEPFDIEYRLSVPQKGERWFRTRTSVERGVDRKGTHVFGIIEDITVRKSLGDQLTRAQRMESVGRLAGGIAHDINNVLTVILSSTAMLRAGCGSVSEYGDRVGAIQKAADHAATLTRQLLAFAKRQVLEARVEAPHELVDGVLPLVRRLLGEDIRLEVLHQRGTPRVRVDRVQIEQVILNLAANSRDAMKSAGTLRITTGAATIDQSDPARAGVVPGEYAVLSVEDSGCGISERDLPHIFEPFFTTKGPGSGTGLGLAMVHGIIAQHGGFIDVDAGHRRGARFSIHLPSVGQVAHEPEPPAIEHAPTVDRPAVVLVVDDEPLVRHALSGLLRTRGYTVIEAESPDDAIRIAAGLGNPVDLLITDMVMPGMSGTELFDQLVAVRPGLRVVFSSGYSEDALSGRSLSSAHRVFLPKPYSPDALFRKVREALSA